MNDEPLKQLRDWQDSVRDAGPFQVPEYEDFARMVEAMEGMAERIETLEADLASGSFYKESDIDRLMERAETAEAALAASEAKVARLVAAGNWLSVRAQTTGGTAGRDGGLVDAVEQWSAALASVDGAQEGEG